MQINLTVESEPSRSARAQQLSAMFDIPAMDKCRMEWRGEIPIEADDWNVGLIVGPSGCGKTSIARDPIVPRTALLLSA
jgi:ABC-type oligopeptide transport system ATPase subunit